MMQCSVPTAIDHANKKQPSNAKPNKSNDNTPSNDKQMHAKDDTSDNDDVEDAVSEESHDLVLYYDLIDHAMMKSLC
jgi:hypothetical protein